jgi:cystathionine beta-lyase/cystathionine gamma-synthase
MLGEPGYYIYSRSANPNVVAFERTVAALEGAEAAVATGAGMAAISSMLVALLSPGDHVVVGRDMYGSTTALLGGPLARFGIALSAAADDEASSFAAAMRPATKLLLVETVSNPLMRVADVPALAEVAHSAGALLAVDASFTSPALSRPLEQGADIVLHSATKYLGGHSDVTAGVVAGTNAVADAVRAVRNLFGTVCSPLDAWLALRGIKTLALRMERHSSNAFAVARFLAGQPKVRHVYFPGLADDAGYERACRLFPRGTGGMLSFELDGGRAEAERFIGGLSLIRFAASLADVATTISHPALTSHRAMAPLERARLGITDGLIRVSVGIESADDICADLARGLAAV